MKAIITAALSLTMLGVGACKKFDEAVNNVKNEGSLSATVDGKSYSAGATTVSFGTHTLWLKGTNFSNDEELSITIDNYDKTTSKYTFDFVNNTAVYRGDNSSDNLSAHSGELEIQHTGDKSAKGTFHFETQDGKKVTNGNFNVNWD